MSCYISLSIMNERFEFRIKKLTRKYLYGHKEVVAKNGGEECEKAYLNENGMIHLTNGCTKFFSPEVDEASDEIQWETGTNKKSADYYFTHSLASCTFDINKGNALDYPEIFLERKVISAYELTSGDKKQLETARALLGSKIWICSSMENGQFALFANDDGLFASVFEMIKTGSMYEETAVSLDEESAVFDDDAEIDFENLW